MYNHNKAQQSKNRVHISWDILYGAVWCRYNAVNFLESSHNGHPEAPRDLCVDVTVVMNNYLFILFCVIAAWTLYTVYAQLFSSEC